jgi:hypothetical protein
VPANAGYLKKTIAIQQHQKKGRMDKDLLFYKLEMQSKFKSWIISYAENPLQRAQSGHIAKRRTIENGQIKMIVEEKGKLLLEPQP